MLFLTQDDISQVLIDEFRATVAAKARGTPQREFCRWAFPDDCPEVAGLGLFARSTLEPDQVIA